jgi:NTP pyrophosphatase (non-canonical NTP hydrolase)
MDLNEAIKETKKVCSSIPTPNGKEWDAKTRFIDLVEEVGELANALLLEHGDKSEKRRRAELVDSVCDVLFDVLMLADAYGIDLDKEYPKVLEHLRQRAEKGGFV